MPITVAERFGSGESTKAFVSSGSRNTKKYLVRGSDDEVAIKEAVSAAAPTTMESLSGRSITVAQEGPGIWGATVTYENRPSEGDSSFTFDTGGGIKHISQAISVVSKYARPDFKPPDFKGAIGVTKDSVEGVDITVPVYQFSETHIFDDADVDTAYTITLRDLTGTVNDGTFKGFAAGEVLFMGASGSRNGTRAEDKWEITFKFSVSTNKTGIVVGDLYSLNGSGFGDAAGTRIAAQGWDYLDVQYESVEDTVAKAVIKRPVSAQVVRVYERKNFALLGI